jgi:hypothetical protein
MVVGGMWLKGNVCCIFKGIFQEGLRKLERTMNHDIQWPCRNWSRLPPEYNCGALRYITKQGDYLPLLPKDHVAITCYYLVQEFVPTHLLSISINVMI